MLGGVSSGRPDRRAVALRSVVLVHFELDGRRVDILALGLGVSAGVRIKRGQWEFISANEGNSLVH